MSKVEGNPQVNLVWLVMQILAMKVMQSLVITVVTGAMGKTYVDSRSQVGNKDSLTLQCHWQTSPLKASWKDERDAYNDHEHIELIIEVDGHCSDCHDEVACIDS